MQKQSSRSAGAAKNAANALPHVTMVVVGASAQSFALLTTREVARLVAPSLAPPNLGVTAKAV
jgi:hypothetical protein